MNPYQTEPSLLAIFLNSKQKELLIKKQVSFPMIQAFLRKKEKIFQDIPIYSNYKFTDNIKIYQIPEDSERNFLFELLNYLPNSISGDPDIDEVYFVYLEGIFPLLDETLTLALKERHKKYLSQYSYSENLPIGIVPYFVSREFVLSLPENLTQRVHEFFLKNINNYDTEIFYHPPDLRQFRLNFSLDSLRSIRFVQDVLSFNPNVSYTELLDFIKAHPSSFRAFPSYIELEIFKGCSYNCIFCPRTFADLSQDNQEMELISFERILEELERNFPSPFTLTFGGLGEPLLHSKFNAFLKTGLSSYLVEELIIETALYTSTKEFFQALRELGKELISKLTVIVNLPSVKGETYQALTKGNVGLEIILQNLNELKNILSKENLYIQILKIQEVELEIEEYFNYFEKEGYNVLLQKYNSYAGKMPERRVSDLTPIQREFCWHLARDLYIRFDGEVLLCKQLPEKSLGNIQKDDLSIIWDRGLEYFSYSLLNFHDKIPAPCQNCDEWYTFNA